MDLVEAIITDIYNLITSDAEMRTLMGGSVEERGEWLYEELDEVDPEFDYLVHALEEAPDGLALADGWYTVDAYVYCEERADKEKLYRIRGRLVVLLDHRWMEGKEYGWCYLRYTGRGRRLPTDNTQVKRYSLPFEARCARTQEIKSILAR